MTTRVRERLTQVMTSGTSTSLEDVANYLGMNIRTLQRRLTEEGTSYQAVQTKLRRELACAWLEQPSLAVYEIAYLLGFSDRASFHRAFKRWTGETPAEYRWRVS